MADKALDGDQLEAFFLRVSVLAIRHRTAEGYLAVVHAKDLANALRELDPNWTDRADVQRKLDNEARQRLREP